MPAIISASLILNMIEIKIAIVTGCNGGIGQAICTLLREQGFSIIGFDLMPIGRGVDYYYQVDLANHGKLLECLKEVENRHAKNLYGLVNNAGLYEALEFACLTVADYERIMAVNIRAPLFISQWFAKVLTAHCNNGAIVNIASISGEQGSKDVVYGVSKGAMINLTKSLSLALAPSIRVNTVSPGIVFTSMAKRIPPERMQDYTARISSRRIGLPEDIANTVAFLLNEKSSYINNAIVSVNGGLL